MAIEIQFPPLYSDQANAFFEAYQDIAVVNPPDQEITDLISKEKRTCRFCNKSYPAVTFNNEAHAIPHFLGNKFLVSDFECDACNKKFGKYDCQLANYIGMMRTISMVRGKKKVPTVSSKDHSIQAKKTDFFGAKSAVKLGSAKNDQSAINVDLQTGLSTVTYDKQPYRPFDVFRSLLKISLTVLPSKYVSDYPLAYWLLQNKDFPHWLKGFSFPLIKHILPGQYPDPTVFLFQSKDIESNIPALTMVLLYQSFMFQIYVPFHKDFLKNQTTELSVDAPIFPPFFDTTGNPNFKHLGQSIEEMKSMIEKTETETINFQLAAHELTNMSAMDMITQKTITKEFDPKSIVGFVIIKDENFSVPLKDC